MKPYIYLHPFVKFNKNLRTCNKIIPQTYTHPKKLSSNLSLILKIFTINSSIIPPSLFAFVFNVFVFARETKQPPPVISVIDQTLRRRLHSSKITSVIVSSTGLLITSPLFVDSEQ
ncbi:unnamed protein product [Vicia faba]|uniref:Uncharacterized protein n=1 Tax=Vicia faba TaxID=3906 RepID=A0AAV0ZHY2_VICFA|nr:unnamed protein product [Vicia faba]